MNKHKNKSKLVPFLIVSFVGSIFIIYYSSLTSPMEKLIALLIAFTICIPFIISMISFLFSSFAKELKRQDANNPYTRKVDEYGRVILKKDYYKSNSSYEEKPTSEYKGKPKIVTTEGYSELKNIIIASSKNKLLGREAILEFKAELRNILGVHYECYKSMRFTNDMHEIYTLIKSSKLTTEDYNELSKWISNHLNLDNVS